MVGCKISLSNNSWFQYYMMYMVCNLIRSGNKDRYYIMDKDNCMCVCVCLDLCVFTDHLCPGG